MNKKKWLNSKIVFTITMVFVGCCFVSTSLWADTVGNTTVFGSISTSNNRRAMPFTMPEDGDITSVTMYHTGGSGSMILGVYDGSSTPQNRLGVTATTAVSGSTGWQTINLTAPAFVANGATVWLAWVYESNPGIAYQTGSPGRYQSTATWSGGMPDPFGSGSQANYLYSIYANYTDGGGTVDPPVANFSGSPTTVDEGQSVSFTDLSSNNPTSWSWTFDGGTPSSSSQQNPTVTYNTACSTYTVSLTVSNSAGSDTETKTDYIAVDEELPTVGNTTVFGSISTSAYRRAMPFTMPAKGTIISVTMYHIGGSGSMILGVYDGEDTPQNRLGVTETTAVSGSTGWQTIELTTPVSVESGSTVWLAWVYENNPGIAYQAGSPGRYQSASTWSGGMPDPFGSGSQADYIYSIHANYSPLHVSAEVLDEITLSMWEQENFVPPLEVTTEVPPLDETVIRLLIYLPAYSYSEDCDWDYAEARIGIDGNISLANKEQFSSSVFASVAGISHTEASAGPWWKWFRICCISQWLICNRLQSLFPWVPMNCLECYLNCLYFLVPEPCHACKYGGSDLLCIWFGDC